MSVQTYQEIVRNELLIYQKSFAYYKSSEEYALGFATTEKDSIELAIAYLDQDLERIKEELTKLDNSQSPSLSWIINGVLSDQEILDLIHDIFDKKIHISKDKSILSLLDYPKKLKKLYANHQQVPPEWYLVKFKDFLNK